jgi:hypothetical protein
MSRRSGDVRAESEPFSETNMFSSQAITTLTVPVQAKSRQEDLKQSVRKCCEQQPIERALRWKDLSPDAEAKPGHKGNSLFLPSR